MTFRVVLPYMQYMLYDILVKSTHANETVHIRHHKFDLLTASPTLAV